MLSVDITVTRGDFTLSAAFEAGAGITVIAGASGAGKSTLAAALAGLITADRGHIAVGGAVLFDDTAGINVPPAQRRAGYVLQDALLFPHLTVWRNLTFGHRDGSHSMDEIIRLLDLEPLLDRKPAALSGGEQQRVSIGRALLSHPAFLVLDEPLAHLDRTRRNQLMTFFEQLRGEIPVIYISHNWPEIIRLGDTIVLMEDGSVTAAGTPSDVFAARDTGPLVPSGVVIDAPITNQTGDGLARLETHGGPIYVPLHNHDHEQGKTARVFIDAHDVALALTRPEGLSIQNVLEGTIIALTPIDPAHIDVSLDLGDGQILRAQITTRARESLSLAPGMTVFALVKSVALDRALSWDEIQ